jgi:excisionase family DNA binding protein
MDIPGYISVKEFAARQNLTEGAIRKWVRLHGLPHTRIGKRILIPEDAIQQMHARQKQEG